MAKPRPKFLTDDAVCPYCGLRKVYCPSDIWANRNWYTSYEKKAQAEL